MLHTQIWSAVRTMAALATTKRIASAVWGQLNAYMVMQMLLLCYYPILYLSDASRTLLLAGHGREPLHGMHLVATASVTTGPHIYFILSRHSLWAVLWQSWNGSRKQTSRDDCNDTKDPAVYEKVSDPPSIPEIHSTNIETGLTSEEVSARQLILGFHEAWIPPKLRVSVWQRLSDPVQTLISANVVLALLLHNWWHLIPICTLWVSTFRVSEQQRDADDVVTSLMWDHMQPSIVLRDSMLQEVSARDLVPGDIVHVSKGSVVPADGRVVAMGDAFEVDESSITGEDLAVSKDEDGLCYTNTGVLRGDAFLEVNGTGRNTFIGRTVAIVQGDKEKGRTKYSVSEYTVVMQTIGGIFLTMACASIFLLPCLALHSEVYAVGVCLTMHMLLMVSQFLSTAKINSLRATNAAELAETGCILQRLEASESLAGISILCVDKTGSITENRPMFFEPYCISCEPEELILAACLSSPSNTGDTVERAMARMLKQFPETKAVSDRCRIIDHQGYDFENGRNFMQCLIESPHEGRMFCARGGPKAIVDLCARNGADDLPLIETYKEAVRGFANRGFTSIAVARKLENGEWNLLGFWPCFDPPRGTTKLALELADELHVRVKISTGNAVPMAKQFAQNIGIQGEVLDPDVIDELSKVPTPQLRAKVVEAEIYAATAALDEKETIIDILQESGTRVAVAGDSFSHIPQMVKADCGIAAAGATEAVMDQSDICMLEKSSGLFAMVQAVRSSRRTFQRIHNYIVQQVVLTIHVLFVMLWFFWAYRHVLDIRPLFIYANVVQLMPMTFGSKTTDMSYQRRPVTWSSRNLLQEVLPLGFVTILSSCIRILYIDLKELEPALLLSILLSDTWMSLLVHTDGRVWFFTQDAKRFFRLMCLDMLCTVVYMSGWCGRASTISYRSAISIWTDNLVAFVLCTIVRYYTYFGDLVEDA